MVDRLIAGDGWLPGTGSHDAPDNPPAIRIIEYTNVAGRTAWGVVFEGDRDPYRYELETEYVRSPVVIWRRPGCPLL